MVKSNMVTFSTGTNEKVTSQSPMLPHESCDNGHIQSNHAETQLPYSDSSRQSTTPSGRISLENKLKMKALVKEKLKKNLKSKSKKVVKLQAIDTVKSIGEFTESEKRILE